MEWQSIAKGTQKAPPKKLFPKTLPTIFHVCLWKCMFSSSVPMNEMPAFQFDASMQVSSGTGMAFGRALLSMVISLASEETFTLSSELNRFNAPFNH